MDSAVGLSIRSDVIHCASTSSQATVIFLACISKVINICDEQAKNYMPYAAEHLMRVADGAKDIVRQERTVNSDMLLSMLLMVVRSIVQSGGGIGSIPGIDAYWNYCYQAHTVGYQNYELQPSDIDLLIGSPDPKAICFSDALSTVAFPVLIGALGVNNIKDFIAA